MILLKLEGGDPYSMLNTLVLADIQKQEGGPNAE
jgi:hypothetical protein